jgi:hypothetical protein
MIVWVKRLMKKCNEENLLIIMNTMQFLRQLDYHMNKIGFNIRQNKNKILQLLVMKPVTMKRDSKY